VSQITITIDDDSADIYAAELSGETATGNVAAIDEGTIIVMDPLNAVVINASIKLKKIGTGETATKKSKGSKK
jgi:hypothetical protein